MPWTKNIPERDQTGTKRTITFDLDYESQTIIRSRRKWQESLPISEINKLTLNRFDGSVTAETNGGNIVWSFSGQSGRTFFDDIRRFMAPEEDAVESEKLETEAAAHMTGTANRDESLSGQLAGLAALHEAGSLSDEEFQAAKTKILGL